MEIEKHQTALDELDNISEGGSATNDSLDPGEPVADLMFSRSPGNGLDGPQTSNSKWIAIDGKEVSGNGSNSHGNLDLCADDVSS